MTNDVTTQLADYFAYVDEAQGAVDLSGVLEPAPMDRRTAGSEGMRHRRWRPVWVVAAAALMTLALIGGAALLLGRSSDSLVEPAGTTATTPNSAPSTEPVVTDGEIIRGPFDTGWVPALQQGEGLGVGGGSIWRLASTDFGVWAFGFTCESIGERGSSDCVPAVWASADGLNWDKVFGPEAGLAEGRITAVTSGGPGSVAVGGTCTLFSRPPQNCLPAVWTTSNGGDWTPHLQAEGTFEACRGTAAVLCRLDHVVRTGEVLVASGFDAAGFGVWTSPDGEVWTKVSLDPEQMIPGYDEELVRRDVEFRHLVAAGPGVVALGNEGETLGAIWTSPDGHTWERVEDPDGLFGGVADTWSHTEFETVKVWRGQIFAVGEECHIDHCDQMVWTSTDGATWDVRPLASEWESAEAQWVTSVGDALVMAGNMSTDAGAKQPALMFSRDGDTWTAYGLDPELFGALIYGDVITEFEGRLIAISGGDQIYVWTPQP